MNNQTEQIVAGSIVALVGVIATAIVNLMLNGKGNINLWWFWGIGGLFCTLVVLRLYRISQHNKLTYGHKVTIRSYDNNYVIADLNRDRQLFGRTKSINAWGNFEIIDASMPFSQKPNRTVHYGDKVAFKALNSKRFVGADLNHEKQLTTWAMELREWETFVLCLTPNNSSVIGDIVQYKNPFALKAYNEKYVKCIINGDGSLLADSPHIKDWETFVFINPTPFK